MHIKPLKLIQQTALALGILTSASLLIPSAYAAPSSNVAWTSEMRNMIKNADIANGKKIVDGFCVRCHGVDGSDIEPIEEEDTPYLFGQNPYSILKQIIDFKDSTRKERTMTANVRKITTKEAADIAAYYAAQPLPLATVKAEKVTPAAKKLAEKGDGSRFIPPCAGCHGQNGEGSIVDVPSLAGQSTSYFKLSMTEYQDDERANDIYSRMRFIAKQLTEQEINELADYYAAIGEYNVKMDELVKDEGPEEPNEPKAPTSPTAPKAD
ncbi:MAG: c-type cytochrome [Cocleimonas sp.]|nr:c-type cytochrome [Cocleimonas sp.]